MSLSPSAKSRGAVVSYLRESDHGKITEQAQNYLKKYACWPRNFVQIESKIEHVSPLTSKQCSSNTIFQTKCRLHVNDTITGYGHPCYVPLLGDRPRSYICILCEFALH